MKLISADFETPLINTGYPDPLGYQGLAPIPICLSAMEAKGQPVLTVDIDQQANRFHRWMKDDNTTLVFQNAPFDLLVAVTHLGLSMDTVFDKYNKGLIRDTQIREMLIALADGEAVRNPGKRYSLEAHVKKYLKKDISADKGEDAWRMRYAELYGVPLKDWPKEAIDYPLADARHTLQVFAHQHKLKHLFQSNELPQTRAAWDLHLISLHSPRVDPEQVEIFEAGHKEQVEIAQAPFIKKGLLKWNKNRNSKHYAKDDPRRGGWSMDTKLLKKAIQADYTRQGLVVPGTPGGDISTAGDTLKGCSNKILQAYGEAATDIKMVDAFVPMLKRACENEGRRVSPRYTVILKTGRTSCSGPNLQQMPKAPGSRECFLPEDDHIFVSIDFNSMEMYCLGQTVSQLYGTTKLLDTLNSGLDPHLIVCEDISGMTYEQLDAGKNAEDPTVKNYRALGKIMNFGFGGGMGAATCYGNMEPYERATLAVLYPDQNPIRVIERLIGIWKTKWELYPMFERASRLCTGGNRPTYTCPTTGRIKALNGYCQYCNAHFQPIAADGMKAAMAKLTEDCYGRSGTLNRYGVKIAIEIHDEFVFSGPVEGLDVWVPHAQQLMKKGAETVLPLCNIQTEAEVCGERWRKKGVSVEEYLESLDE